MKYRLPLLLILLVFASGTAMDHAPAEVQSTEGPLKISLCQLKSDPKTYNHKLVEVTGFVSHGFEDFTLFDPACGSWPSVWLEYGGKAASGTIYCCGVTPARSRPQPLVIEGVSVGLVEDDRFKQFDRLIAGNDSVGRATIVGRFFSGEFVKTQNGGFWGGYGHLGCCTLLAIQQIVSVDSRESTELDYGASVDQPNVEKAGCGYKILHEFSENNSSIKAQERADLGQEEWAFSDPERVATEGLARLLKLTNPSTIKLQQTSRTQGRIIYWSLPKNKTRRYMVVVSRPYLLSFYAKDPKRVAWVLAGAYETFCGGG
ncbi:MAG TPA: hypothetical protein VE980_02535 [Pyrinomonadaceae bacterium]|nr:hypothetical protein [Pyrinomonadaceae bacterium]